MATRKPDTVKYSSPDGGQTKYIENQDLPARLKTAYDKKQNFTMPTAKQTGSGDRKAQVAKRQAKTKTYLERKRGSTPTKRTTTTQPVSRPQNVQGPLMQNGSYGNAPATPPAQTFAQNGMQRGAPPQPQYNPWPTNYNMQRQGPPAQPQYNPLPQNRPSAFGQQPQMQQPYQQPNSAMTMGIQPMGNPYMNSQNPSQMMSGYQPPMGNPNPWGRRW